MKIYGRHGDLVIERLTQEIEGDLRTEENPTLAGRSSGHPHRLMGKVMLRREDDGRTLVRLGESMLLIHEGGAGHETATMLPGDYEIRSLRERGDGLDRRVED